MSVPIPSTAHPPKAAAASAQQEALSVILVTGGYDNTIRFWEAWSGVCSKTLNHQEHVRSPRNATQRIPTHSHSFESSRRSK